MVNRRKYAKKLRPGISKLDQYIATQGGQEQTKESTEHSCDNGVDERSVQSLGMNDVL